jgi:hypothetical protein
MTMTTQGKKDPNLVHVDNFLELSILYYFDQTFFSTLIDPRNPRRKVVVFEETPRLKEIRELHRADRVQVNVRKFKAAERAVRDILM